MFILRDLLTFFLLLAFGHIDPSRCSYIWSCRRLIRSSRGTTLSQLHSGDRERLVWKGKPVFLFLHCTLKV